jgi:hypothetical protein
MDYSEDSFGKEIGASSCVPCRSKYGSFQNVCDEELYEKLMQDIQNVEFEDNVLTKDNWEESLFVNKQQEQQEEGIASEGGAFRGTKTTGTRNVYDTGLDNTAAIDKIYGNLKTGTTDASRQ